MSQARIFYLGYLNSTVRWVLKYTQVTTGETNHSHEKQKRKADCQNKGPNIHRK